LPGEQKRTKGEGKGEGRRLFFRGLGMLPVGAGGLEVRYTSNQEGMNQRTEKAIGDGWQETFINVARRERRGGPSRERRG